jgi:NAD(P)-dependent dehydrogenase (short-subunit alcohol dehydrogenase family)
MLLKERIAIVTGGARGIGAAIAARFRAEGATVVIADVAGDVDHMRCDVSKRDDVEALVTNVLRQHGAIDVLVNNAAVSHVADVLELTEADFDRVIGINLKGSFLMLQACAKAMLAQVEKGRAPGAIVNISSVNDTLAIPEIAAYCMAKGGVAQLTRAASIQLAPHGIRVNAIGPGSIMTDMLKWVMTDHAAVNRIMSRTPMGRVGEPEEIAAIAAFLASKESSYITGQVIYADGGRMPMNYTVPVKG